MSQLFKKTKLVLLCTLMLGFSISSQSLEAATLHAVIVGDTNDESIGDDVAVDVDNMYYYLKRAANKAGLSSNISTIYGNSADRETVIKKIEQLEVGPDDVVITHFAMHGYRFRDKTSIWPNLYFGESNNGLELEYVISKIREKNPRMFMAIADTCNTYSKKGSISTKRDIGWIDWLLGTTEKKNFKKLFLNYQGSIIVAAAIPGQPSWGNATIGGNLTSSLVESLKEVLGHENSEDVSWEAIFSQIEGRIEKLMNPDNDEDPIVQTPYFEIELQELDVNIE